MHLIAHRGNLNGKSLDNENTTEYIDQAISKGFECEIDLWCINDELYLGHDAPEHKIDMDYILSRHDKLWVHCKNYQALKHMKIHGNNINYFFHDKDKYTITSKGYIWGNINSIVDEHTICVMPECADNNATLMSALRTCVGICSDNISFYKTLM
jgi:hypothetical protein